MIQNITRPINFLSQSNTLASSACIFGEQRRAAGERLNCFAQGYSAGNPIIPNDVREKERPYEIRLTEKMLGDFSRRKTGGNR